MTLNVFLFLCNPFCSHPVRHSYVPVHGHIPFTTGTTVGKTFFSSGSLAVYAAAMVMMTGRGVGRGGGGGGWGGGSSASALNGRRLQD